MNNIIFEIRKFEYSFCIIMFTSSKLHVDYLTREYIFSNIPWIKENWEEILTEYRINLRRVRSSHDLRLIFVSKKEARDFIRTKLAPYNVVFALAGGTNEKMET